MRIYRRGPGDRSRYFTLLILYRAHIFTVLEKHREALNEYLVFLYLVDRNPRLTCDEEYYLKCYAGGDVAYCMHRLRDFGLNEELRPLWSVWSEDARELSTLNVDSRLRAMFPATAYNGNKGD